MSIKEQMVRAHTPEGAKEQVRGMGFQTIIDARLLQVCGGPQGDGDLWSVLYDERDPEAFPHSVTAAEDAHIFLTMHGDEGSTREKAPACGTSSAMS